MCKYVDIATSMDTVSVPSQCTRYVGRCICIDVLTAMCVCSLSVDVGGHIAWVTVMVITKALPPVPSHNMTVCIRGASGRVCASSTRLFYRSNSIEAIDPWFYEQHRLYHY